MSSTVDHKAKQGKNLVNSLTAIEKQNPIKAVVNRVIGMISRKSSDQQKSSNRSQSRNATCSPSDSYNCDGLSDTKSLSDDVEIADEAIPEPVDPVGRTIMLSEEEIPEDGNTDKEMSPVESGSSSVQGISSTKHSTNHHQHNTLQQGSTNRSQILELWRKTSALKAGSECYSTYTRTQSNNHKNN